MIKLAILLIFASLVGDVSEADVTGLASSLKTSWSTDLVAKQSQLEACARVFVEPSINEPTFFTDDKKRQCVKVKIRKDVETLKKQLKESVSELQKQIKNPTTWNPPRKRFNELTDGLVCEVHTTAGDRIVGRGGAVSAQAGSTGAYELMRQREEANVAIPFDVTGCVSSSDGSYRGTYGKYVIRFTTEDKAGGGSYRISGLVRIESVSKTEIRMHVFSEAEREDLTKRVNEKLVKKEAK